MSWLVAQIDEDERLLNTLRVGDDVPPAVTIWGTRVWSFGRAVAEVKAKRELLDELFWGYSYIDSEYGCNHDAAEIAAGECPRYPPRKSPGLRLLANVYADRPGYRTEWTPSDR